MTQTIANAQTDRAEWLAQRRKYLGATDVASILGKGFGSPLSVYNEKHGLPNPEPDEDAMFRMDVGLALEPLLGDYFTKETGIQVKRVPTLFHPEYPFIGANLDFITEDGKGIVETKTYGVGRHHEFGDEGSDDVPDGYHIQITIQTGLAILNGYPAQGGFLYACSLGTQSRKIFAVPFDQEFFDLLVSKAVEFWDKHVDPQIPPDAVAKDEERLRLMYPDDDGNYLIADPEDDELVLSLIGAAGIRKAACESFDGLKAKILERIGSASGMDSMYGRVTYKAASGKNVVDWESVARELDPSAELLARHTSYKAGSRRLVLPKGGVK